MRLRPMAVAAVLFSCNAEDALDLGDTRTFAEVGLPLSAGTDDGQVAPPGVQFDQDPLVPGDVVTLRVTGITPNDVVYFGRGAGTGAGPCVGFLNVCLDLLPPVELIGVAIADNTGYAEYSVRLPNQVPPQYIYTQAIVTGPAGSIGTNTITAPIFGGALDADGDGYCAGSTCNYPTHLPGDCADDDDRVHPGQNGFFRNPFLDNAGQLSYDYDCDGVERREDTARYSCTFDANLAPFCGGHTPGWDGQVPGCGQQGVYASGCWSTQLLLPTCFATNNPTSTQACN